MPLPQPDDESLYRRVTVEFGRDAFADQDPAYRRTPIPDDWLDAPAEADLRETALIREADRHTEGLLHRASMAALVPGNQFSLWVFLHSEDDQPFVMDRYGVTGRSVGNQPLGPLEDVQVYATNPHGIYEGKSHGLCRHQKWLSAEHDLLALRNFVPLYLEDPGHGDWTGSGWCSKCAGYAIRRLNSEQFAHYWTSVQAAYAALYGGRR
ncbi:hypothetical protein G3I32_12915 [Streptomyces coelicoflavus]|uniref:Uncharacterized protein n=1 Tax=Streptomyces coelicoflavus TaxID=285562 RepID=A0A7K3PID6_9ACTN|nr:hypothetical protein [Streptomyces coelicoflavus]NEB09754.1 hypothetical protein [Streptomyces coelicoflavus]